MLAELKRAGKLGTVMKTLSDPPRELWREIWSQQRLRTQEKERLKNYQSHEEMKQYGLMWDEDGIY